jgi:DNA-binding beta-propeller fold protein YncE
MTKLIITNDNCDYAIYDLNLNKIIHRQSITQELDAIDLTGFNRPTFRPFGVTIDDSSVYIVSNDKLGKYNKQDHQFESLIKVPLFVNTHQMVKDKDVIYVCNSSTDTIGIYNLNKQEYNFFDVNTFSFINEPSEPKNLDIQNNKHVNSLFIDDDRIWFCLHNKGETSEYGYFNKKTFATTIVCKAGLQGHNIIVIDNFLYTLSSATGELLSIDLNTKKESKRKIANPIFTFLRGLVYIDGKFLIGCSVNFKTPSVIKHSYIAELNILTG